MSHDIDLILTRFELEELRPQVEGMSDSRHLGGRKWSATLRKVHLDLYVPYESVLGQRLGLKVGPLAAYRETVDGWNVLELPAHVCTKIAAVLDRPESLPGEKDRHEIVDLLGLGVDPVAATTVLVEWSSHGPDELSAMVGQAFGYLQDIDLDRKARARLREMGRQWQESLQPDGEGPLPDDEDERAARDDALVRRFNAEAKDSPPTCGG